MFDQEFSEKRDFIRMFVDADVTFTINGESETYQGKSKELSGKGVAFTTQQTVNDGDVLDIKVSSVIASVPPLEIKANVVRTEAQENDQLLVATVKIQDS